MIIDEPGHGVHTCMVQNQPYITYIVNHTVHVSYILDNSKVTVPLSCWINVYAKLDQYIDMNIT